ncbi:hypothetical protein SAMN05660420_00808 [Desulfuromusa kysingii]|uniref:Uncharacterized protein n=1 Tax=Desulfuromusa kysingii TaxID=37625 RepID=A0A1H3X4N3_9BACT|nr:hypothetical protein [Desulfuromusa kysingii]SDZ93931.1 hypothetical protein SAMN05660420_00808 [Desulfuromusa kysingii]
MPSPSPYTSAGGLQTQSGWQDEEKGGKSLLDSSGGRNSGVKILDSDNEYYVPGIMLITNGFAICPPYTSAGAGQTGDGISEECLRGCKPRVL